METTTNTMDETFNRLEEIREQYQNGLIDKTDALASITILLVAEVIANSKDNRQHAGIYSNSVKKLRKLQDAILLIKPAIRG